MLNEIMHIGVTVSDMDRSLKFYQEILGLKFIGELTMEGPETDLLFNMSNCKARVAYLKGTDEIISPPVELIQFVNNKSELQEASLNKIGISEICFSVKDIDVVYEHLVTNGVSCLSTPQPFDFTKDGFGKSKAIYFRDPDGIILELMQAVL